MNWCPMLYTYLSITDPRDDQKRIERTKGGLLQDLHRWIFESGDYKKWRDEEEHRLLWIKGDPGKGKTMLLCGIINELAPLTKLEDKESTKLLSYFLCQGTDSRINSAAAVLRGLIYLLVDQQPPLMSHIQNRCGSGGPGRLKGVNSWEVLSDILVNILRDASIQQASLVVDALDECETDLSMLLDLIIQCSSSEFPQIKWIVSSRNVPEIERKLRPLPMISLELKQNADMISQSIDAYIRHNLSQIHSIQGNQGIQEKVQEIMQQKANGTFLWVSLVMIELQKIESWNVMKVVEEMPSDLANVYRRMLKKIFENPRIRDSCLPLLWTMYAAFRPLSIAELGLLSGFPGEIWTAPNSTEIVRMCGSFFTIRGESIYFIHQSAKDFLSRELEAEFPDEMAKSNYNLFTRSLQAMSATLIHDIYGLHDHGFLISELEQPEPDPLAAVRYSCIYWVDHLKLAGPSKTCDDLLDNSTVHRFLTTKYLYWLEALSLLHGISDGMIAIQELEKIVENTKTQLSYFVRDARKFILSHKRAIETAPLQVYMSALVFSPTSSLVRCQFAERVPKWIVLKPSMKANWDACRDSIPESVTFSIDGKQLASGFRDTTVKIWDAITGNHTQTLKGHNAKVFSVVFSGDSVRLASGSEDGIVKIWNANTGACLLTVEGHTLRVIALAFSVDNLQLASASENGTTQIWDACTGNAIQAFKHGDKQTQSGELVHGINHGNEPCSVAFSASRQLCAARTSDDTIKVYSMDTGAMLYTLEGSGFGNNSIAFSQDGRRLATVETERTIKIWDLAISCHLNPHADSQTGSHHLNIPLDISLSTPKPIRDFLHSVIFSREGRRFASASHNHIRIWEIDSGNYTLKIGNDGLQLASTLKDGSIKIWNMTTGRCIQKIDGHGSSSESLVFSKDGLRLATVFNHQIWIWDIKSGNRIFTIEPESNYDTNHVITFSTDGLKLASAAYHKPIRILDVTTGDCTKTLKYHGCSVSSAAFSGDGSRLASAFQDKTIKIWDINSGDCLQTVNIGRSIHQLAFDTTGNYLHTSMGVLDLHLASTIDLQQTESTPLPFIRYNMSLSVLGRRGSDQWISQFGRRILWLPPDYRADCSAGTESIIAISCESGGMLIIECLNTFDK
ncbi:quinon protein alcohol dehydrogenase-like superfamily [Trichoderma ceciliae]